MFRASAFKMSLSATSMANICITFKIDEIRNCNYNEINKFRALQPFFGGFIFIRNAFKPKHLKGAQ